MVSFWFPFKTIQQGVRQAQWLCFVDIVELLPFASEYSLFLLLVLNGIYHYTCFFGFGDLSKSRKKPRHFADKPSVWSVRSYDVQEEPDPGGRWRLRQKDCSRFWGLVAQVSQ